jgi:hypothetical protein
MQIKLNALGGSGGTFAVTGGAATFSSSVTAGGLIQTTGNGTYFRAHNYTWMGGSGGDYGSVGYNQGYTSTTTTYNYVLSDFASMIRFDSGGFKFLTAPSGTAGNAISFTPAMTITSGGVVLIGATSTPNSEKFNVTQSGANWGIAINHTNSTQFLMDFRSSGTQVGSIIGAGGVTSYNVTSDYRLKEDLKSINGLDIVNKINIYDYKYKSSGMRMDGVLAHELAEVLPYAVFGVKDGEQMQQVDYSKIVPVMVQAIKELKAELDTLKNR